MQSDRAPTALMQGPAAVTMAVGLIAVIKAPGLFLDPRFWGEEGAVFYPRFLHQSIFEALTFVFIGTLQVWTNAAIYAATFVPLELAPAVTTGISFIVLLIAAWQLGLLLQAYRVPRFPAGLAVLSFCLLPATYEVWLSATNLQWIFQLSALLVVAMPSAWHERHWRGGAAWLLVCGLSGVPAVLLAPVLLARAAIERSRAVAVEAGALVVCGLVQAAALALSPSLHAGRTFSATFFTLTLPTLLQTIGSPLVGADRVNHLADLIKGSNLLMGGVLAALIAVLAALVWLVRGAAWRDARWIVAAWLSVPVIQSVLAINPPTLISGASGARYFMAGSVALCLVLALAARAATWRGHVAVALLLVMLCSGVVDWRTGGFNRAMLSGPSWRDQAVACGARCEIEIWPGSWKTRIER